jgi:hypothetical protein
MENLARSPAQQWWPISTAVLDSGLPPGRPAMLRSLQMRIAAYLYARQDECGIRVVPELRIRVTPTRNRFSMCVLF